FCGPRTPLIGIVQFHVLEMLSYGADGRHLRRRTYVVDCQPHLVRSFLGLGFGFVLLRGPNYGLSLNAAAIVERYAVTQDPFAAAISAALLDQTAGLIPLP